MGNECTDDVEWWVGDDVVEFIAARQEVFRRASQFPAAVDQVESGGNVAGDQRVDDDRAPAAGRVNNGAFEGLDFEQAFRAPGFLDIMVARMTREDVGPARALLGCDVVGRFWPRR